MEYILLEEKVLKCNESALKDIGVKIGLHSCEVKSVTWNVMLFSVNNRGNLYELLL